MYVANSSYKSSRTRFSCQNETCSVVARESNHVFARRIPNEWFTKVNNAIGGAFSAVALLRYASAKPCVTTEQAALN
jgi:hypothetical protein